MNAFKNIEEELPHKIRVFICYFIEESCHELSAGCIVHVINSCYHNCDRDYLGNHAKYFEGVELTLVIQIV